jgi:hypothetical protein
MRKAILVKKTPLFYIWKCAGPAALGESGVSGNGTLALFCIISLDIDSEEDSRPQPK